jgi:hypothetical protein
MYQSTCVDHGEHKYRLGAHSRGGYPGEIFTDVDVIECLGRRNSGIHPVRLSKERRSGIFIAARQTHLAKLSLSCSPCTSRNFKSYNIPVGDNMVSMKRRGLSTGYYIYLRLMIPPAFSVFVDGG